MDWYEIELFFIALNSLICFCALILTTKHEGLSIRSYALALFIVFYVLVPATLIYLGPASIHSNNFRHVFLIALHYPINAFVTVALISFLFGAFFPSQHILDLRLKQAADYLIAPRHILYTLVAVSFVSLIFFIKPFANFEDAVFFTKLMRQGIFKEIWDGNDDFLFFKRFIFLSLIPVLFGSYFSKNQLDRVFLIYFPLAYLLIFLLFLNHGRMAVINLALIFLFTKFLNERHLGKITSILAIFVFTPFLILFLLTSLEIVFSYNASINTFSVFTSIDHLKLLNKFIEEFATPYLSIANALNTDKEPFFFIDFLYGLSGNIFPVNPDWTAQEVNFHNSLLFNTTGGSYPPGMIAFGMYNLPFVGGVLFSLFVGRICYHLQQIGISAGKISPQLTTFYAFLITTTFVLIRTTSPRYYFYDPVNISLIIFLFLSFKILFVRRARLKQF